MTAKTPASTIIGKLAGRLRFPQLFAVVTALFLIDLLIPDMIPFVDEVLLGLLAVLLGTLQDRRSEGGERPAPTGDKPPMKDITPQDR